MEMIYDDLQCDMRLQKWYTHDIHIYTLAHNTVHIYIYIIYTLGKLCYSRIDTDAVYGSVRRDHGVKFIHLLYLVGGISFKKRTYIYHLRTHFMT